MKRGEKQNIFWRNNGWKILVLIKTANSLMEETPANLKYKKVYENTWEMGISYHVNK